MVKEKSTSDGSISVRDLGVKLTAGAIAGISGTSIIYPIDVIKTKIQSSKEKGMKSKINIIKNICKIEGLKGFYKGLSANLIGVTPEKAIKLVVNDLSRDFLAKRLKLKDSTQLPPLYGMLAGAMAGTCQVLATNPMEMVKINMQLNSRSRLSATIRNLGLKGLYKGTAATLMRDIPFSMIFFQSFASICELLKTRRHSNELSLPLVLSAGMLAGSIGAIAATPMDLVKTRFQAEWYSAMRHGTQKGRSIAQIWTDTVKLEGVSALFKGSFQRCLIVGPLFGVSLMVFEFQHRLFLD